MEGAGDTADHEEHGGKQGGGGGSAFADHAEVVEDEADCGGGKYFKEAFYPEVHDPPAPVFHDGDMGVFAVYQRRRVKQADGGSGGGKEDEQALVARLAQCRPDAAQHED